MKEDADCSPSAPEMPRDTVCSQEDANPGEDTARAASGSSGSAQASPRDFRLAAVWQLRPDEDDEGDASLFRDLLRKARGDEALARKWLADICGHSERPRSADTIMAARSFTKGDLDTAALDAGAPEAFFCPISFKLFRDPVMLPTGQTYERRNIERWLAGGSCSCPCTGVALAPPVPLAPNVALRKSIEVWAEQHARWLLGADGKIRAILADEDFPGLPRRGATCGDADLALAVRLQDEEIVQAAGASAAQRRERRQGMRRCSLLAALLYALTAAQVALFVLALWQNGWQIESLQHNPLVGPSEKALQALGLLSTASVVDQHQYWRLITSIFMCSGAIQLAVTLLSLWAFACHLARTRKASALGVAYLYVAGGLLGALLSVNLSTVLPATGAPAAVCALIGAALADVYVGHKAYQHHALTAALMLLALAQFVVTGLLPLSANAYFIAGALLLGVTHVMMDADKMCGLITACMLLLFMLGVLALALVGMLKYSASIGRGCEWCPAVACVPTHWWTCQSALTPQLAPDQAPLAAPSPGAMSSASAGLLI